MARKASSKTDSTANLGFEAKLWLAADKLADFRLEHVDILRCDGDIRKALIEVDLVDSALRDSTLLQSEATLQVQSAAKSNTVALPGMLFYSMQLPVCLWFLARSNVAAARHGFRDRRKQTLFIDTKKMGTLVDRDVTDRELALSAANN
jgi:hypothetical protein